MNRTYDGLSKLAVRSVLVCGLLLFGLLSVAEGQSRKVMKADEFYEAGGWAEALRLYKEGGNLQTVPKDQMGLYLYRVAECYRHLGEYRQAEIWYSKALMRDCPEPKAHFYYAEALLANERYDLAKEEYEAYLKVKPHDPLATNGLRSVELAVAWVDSPSGYTVKPMQLLNSRYNDYSPMYASADYRSLVFTSSREGTMGKEIHAATGEHFADLFASTSNGEGRWSKPKSINSDVNTIFEDGTPNFSADYGTMYFTRCRTSKRHGKLGCQVMEASQTGDGWSSSKDLGLGADSLVYAHPAIAPNGLVLYFASDMPGGFGGLDLWKVTRGGPNDNWGEPINLGSTINTPGNEAFPYVHPDGTLYFASDGHPGMGGYDIFKLAKDAKGATVVENMRYPINSPSDDFGITFQKEHEEGFFSSNRKGGRGGDDIYWFYLAPLEFNLIGQVNDQETQTPVANAKVRLAGSDGSLQTGTTNDKGVFRFMLKPNTDYVAVTNEKGYLNGKLKVSTRGKTESEDMRVSVPMNAIAIEKPITIPNIFYNFNSWELRPESKEALDALVELLNENPGLVIELGAHTDAVGTLEYNYELSQRRAQAVVNYLIEHGIPTARLRAKGYAQTEPCVVDAALNAQFPFLPIRKVLDEAFIASLPDEAQREAANQANRRTEFRVLSMDYVPGKTQGAPKASK